jgi:hypothetical protein
VKFHGASDVGTLCREEGRNAETVRSTPAGAAQPPSGGTWLLFLATQRRPRVGRASDVPSVIERLVITVRLLAYGNTGGRPP